MTNYRGEMAFAVAMLSGTHPKIFQKAFARVTHWTLSHIEFNPTSYILFSPKLLLGRFWFFALTRFAAVCTT